MPNPALVEVESWAAENRPLLELCFEHFHRTLQWPLLEELQHEFELAGVADDVGRLAWAMPRALGFVEQQRLVLLTRALVDVPTATQVLDDWAAALRIAYQRWRDDPNSTLRRDELQELLGGDEVRLRQVSEFLLRESWPFGGGTGGAEDDWSRSIHSGIRVVRSARTAGDIIAARDELMFPPIEVIPDPRPEVGQRLWRPVVHSWQVISHHPLWSAVLATVSGGVILSFVLGGHGSGGQSSPQSPTTAISPPTATLGKKLRERAGSQGARTFTDPFTQSTFGPEVGPNQYVLVSCRVYEPQPPSVMPDGYWYRLASPPWNGRYYAPANSFWNGDVPGRKPYTHNTDFAVPLCG